MVGRNTAPDSVSGRTITFDLALIHVEHRWPSLFTPSRERWGTSDGIVPGRVVWAYWHAGHAISAREALDTAHGIGLALGSEESGGSARREAFDRAFSSE